MKHLKIAISILCALGLLAALNGCGGGCERTKH